MPLKAPLKTWYHMTCHFSALFVLLLTAVLLSDSSGAAPKDSPNLCLNPQARQVTMDRTHYAPLETLQERLQGSRLVLIGELHLTHYGFREQLLTHIQKSRQGRVCYFYELDRDMTLAEHLQSYKEMEDLERLRFVEQQHRLAQNFAWTEFNVDSEVSPEDHSVAELNRRDREMAKRINNLMKTDCDSAVMFVGKAHLVNAAKRRQNLGQLLRKTQAFLTVINLQESADERLTTAWGEDEAIDNQSWNGVCAGAASLPTSAVPEIFLNQHLPQGLRFFPLTRELGTWDSFDLTVLVQDPELNLTRSNDEDDE